MIAIILIAFVIGWFGGIAAYKYGLKNSPVILPPHNRYDKLRELEADREKFKEVKYKIDADYNRRLTDYHIKVLELEKQRNDFYEKNPNYPIKTLFMNVIAPPQKIEIKFID